MQTLALAGSLISRVRRIPRKVWIMLAVSMLVLFVLTMWLAVTVVTRSWNAGTAILERGNTSISAALPGVQERLQTLSPELAKMLGEGRDAVAIIAIIAPEASRQLEAAAPQLQQELERGRQALVLVAPGAAEQLESRMSTLMKPGNRAVATDVPGEDIAGMPRHPELARTGYSLAEEKRTVTYAGPVPFAEALAAYRGPLIAAGFNERILQSSTAGTTAEYRLGERTLLLTVTAQGAAASEVQIAERLTCRPEEGDSRLFRDRKVQLQAAPRVPAAASITVRTPGWLTRRSVEIA